MSQAELTEIMALHTSAIKYYTGLIFNPATSDIMRNLYKQALESELQAIKNLVEMWGKNVQTS